MQGTVCLDERFLRNIFYFRWITNHPANQSAKFSVVLFNQQLERALVALLRPGH